MGWDLYDLYDRNRRICMTETNLYDLAAYATMNEIHTDIQQCNAIVSGNLDHITI